MAELLLLPEVEDDLAEASVWYEDRRAGLGDEFLDCVDASLRLIEASPALYAEIYETFRRAPVRRFPYQIFYLIEDENIVIYGVFHAARNPDKWRGRTG